MNRFEGKVALVTGAGTGIGYAIVRAFAQEGAVVALNDMNEAVAHDAAQKLNNELGRECVYPNVFDVANVETVRQHISAIDQRFGRLDVLVANAGITNYGSFLDYTPEAFDRITSVNLRGTYFTAQAGARAMIARKLPGRIILMSSVTGVQAFPNLGAYGVTKAGIAMMARSLALELGQYGITANAIVPGITKTDRTVADDPTMETTWPAVLSTRKVGQPEDIAATALFLSSPEAHQLTGQSIVVDGGWVIHSPLPDDHPELPAFSSQLR